MNENVLIKLYNGAYIITNVFTYELTFVVAKTTTLPVYSSKDIFLIFITLVILREFIFSIRTFSKKYIF